MGHDMEMDNIDVEKRWNTLNDIEIDSENRIAMLDTKNPCNTPSFLRLLRQVA